ncbi:MAG: hypothetical protein D6744_01620 [Planctomycetota bacterium]|nr:MAG: hypothetical protein D6744_01620 [Planctomycetota bacterium]
MCQENDVRPLSGMLGQHWARAAIVATVLGAVGFAALVGGCPSNPYDPTQSPDSFIFNNTTDPTNGGAAYIGSAACGACHTDIAPVHELHGHAQALKPVQGGPPDYPAAGTRAGVPDPPAGMAWSDIAYVIAGYLHGAFFVDQDGFVVTNGTSGVDSQWNLAFPPNGTAAGFVEYLPDQVEPLPYEYETCFRCHTTGAAPQSESNPASQDGRPGIRGTWSEPGVQCEACHGPGGNHAPNPQLREIFVDLTTATCDRCHEGGVAPDVIPVEDGFIVSNTQSQQLRASGGHSAFTCTICHDPHASSTYDRDRGIRNDCTVCHTDQNMALHGGKTLVFGDHVEPVGCESCHMPYAARSNSSASADLVGDAARVGDVRTHIFRINVTDVGADALFTDDGAAVRLDEQGRAAVPTDFVCLRCHNPGGAFEIDPQLAFEIALDMHGKDGLLPQPLQRRIDAAVAPRRPRAAEQSP